MPKPNSPWAFSTTKATAPRRTAPKRAWLEKAAAQNNTTAQYMLGVLYQRGEGGAQDHAKAREWFEKAAAQTRDKETRQAAQKALQNLNKTGGKKP